MAWLLRCRYAYKMRAPLGIGCVCTHEYVWGGGGRVLALWESRGLDANDETLFLVEDQSKNEIFVVIK